MKKKLVFLTGAGVSAESGIPTFRGGDGLWEGHKIEDVASPLGWKKDPELVLDFYNQRRRAVLSAQPNAAHICIKELEAYFDVWVITQNIDDLHERAGSSRVIHLHGEILKARSTLSPQLVYDWFEDIKIGDQCEKGSQLRPHIVWFGEEVPLMPTCAKEVQKADLFVVVGTSLVVYPAASLVDFVAPQVPIFVVDPSKPPLYTYQETVFIQEPASTGMTQLKEILLSKYL
jgi:NAD-dependent deacetylase